MFIVLRFEPKSIIPITGERFFNEKELAEAFILKKLAEIRSKSNGMNFYFIIAKCEQFSDLDGTCSGEEFDSFRIKL